MLSPQQRLQGAHRQSDASLWTPTSISALKSFPPVLFFSLICPHGALGEGASVPPPCTVGSPPILQQTLASASGRGVFCTPWFRRQPDTVDRG